MAEPLVHDGLKRSPPASACPRRPEALTPGQRLSQAAGHRQLLVLDLIPGHAHRRQPRRLERRVLAAVALKGPVRGMKPKAVDLDYEALGAPEEVDLVAVNTCVDLGRRQLGPADQVQKPLLGLGSGQGGARLALEQGRQAGASGTSS